MTWKEDLEREKKLADVMLDNPQKITIGGKEYKLKALKMYTRWKISECINEMQIAENDTINILESMFSDVPLLSRIITYAILRDRDKIENEELFDATYSDILECDNPQEFLDAVTTIIKMMDVEWFFFIQEVAKSINILPSKAGYREKNKKENPDQEYTMQPVNLAKSED